MSSEPNSLSALLGAWLLFQIGSGVITALAALYALFCLGKTASAMERLANAMETLAERQNAAPILPGQAPTYGTPTYNVPTYPQPSHGPQPVPPSYAPYPPAQPVAPPVPPSPYPSAAPPPVAVVVGPVIGPGAAPPAASPEVPSEAAPTENSSDGTSHSDSNVPHVPRREVMP